MFLDLREGVAELFLDAQSIVIDIVRNSSLDHYETLREDGNERVRQWRKLHPEAKRLADAADRENRREERRAHDKEYYATVVKARRQARRAA